MDVINLQEKFSQFSDHWHPRIIGQLNGQLVKIAKVQGDFIWHSHEKEDELFYVIEGRLWIDFRDKTIELNPGEMVIVPRGVEHRPRTEGEVKLMLFEPVATKHTGDVKHELTRNDQEFI
jgi:mannose-6-phosphate isomerase-like protein (cupin superfamily)